MSPEIKPPETAVPETTVPETTAPETTAPETTAPPTVPRQSQPTFLFVCKDGPDAPRLRAEHLEGHLAHVEANWQRYVTAGPLKSPGNASIHGSALIVIAEDLAAAWAVMNGDPYFTTGLFASVEVHDITMSIGRYPGGKIWESAEAIRHKANGG